MSTFMTVATVLLLLLVGTMTVFSFAWKGYEIGIILSIVLFAAFVGLGFYFNYGLSVSPKYVTVVYYNEIRIFKYDEVTRIELWIDDDLIVGSVKARGEKEYNVCFSDFNVDHGVFFQRLWDVKVRVGANKANKILSDSANYDKIIVHLKN